MCACAHATPCAQAQEEIRRLRSQAASERTREAASAAADMEEERPPLTLKSTNKVRLSAAPRHATSASGMSVHAAVSRAVSFAELPTPVLQADSKTRGKDAGKPKSWAPGSVSGLFKPDSQPDTFSLDGGSLTLHEPPTVLRATEPETDEQLLQVKVTRILLRSYFSIVRASLVDTVPKAVMHFLVNAVQRGLQQHLIRTLYRDEIFGDLLREQPELAQHRMMLSERLGALNEAVNALQEVPEELRRTG